MTDTPISTIIELAEKAKAAREFKIEWDTTDEQLALIKKTRRDFPATAAMSPDLAIEWGNRLKKLEARVLELEPLARIGAAVQQEKPIYRHKKTGGLYERLLPMGRVQSTSPLHDMDEVAIYRAQKDGTLWARKASEFEDGRFEQVKP